LGDLKELGEMTKNTRRRTKAAAKPASRRPARKSASTRASQSSSETSAPAPAEPRALPHAAKGKRASFYPDPAVDALLAVIAALTAEVSVAFDRIATLERLLERHDLLPPDAVESYEADDAEARRRNADREALIDRVFRVIRLQGREDPPR
jgi:hypothetical protein